MPCFGHKRRATYIFCVEHQIHFLSGQVCPKCKKEGHKQMRLYKLDKEK